MGKTCPECLKFYEYLNLLFCPDCGAELELICPWCGEDIEEWWYFCCFCRNDLY